MPPHKFGLSLAHNFVCLPATGFQSGAGNSLVGVVLVVVAILHVDFTNLLHISANYTHSEEELFQMVDKAITS